MKCDSTKLCKSALIETLGCKVNQAEAASLARSLEIKGYSVDPQTTSPDVVVVNTCCVTARAEGKSRRAVKRLAEAYPNAKLVVTGCLAEVNPDTLVSVANGALIVGVAGKSALPELVDGEVQGTLEDSHAHFKNAKEFVDLGPAGSPGRSRAFLKIQDGCSQCCSYCIVPTARGPSRSLAPEKVIEYALQLSDEGFGEIVLTGIHLGAYGRDLNPRASLEAIVDKLVKTRGRTRFRLSSIEPQEITPGLIRTMADHSRVCRHLHIPLQSGDDRILRLMGRPYDVALIRDLFVRVSTSSPDVCLGMDVMVGFPGEDEESFRTTEALIEELRPSYLHVFPFSPRPGTRAASMKPGVDDKTARERVDVLRSLSNRLKLEFYERFVGSILDVTPEPDRSSPSGRLMVRSDNYLPVEVERPEGGLTEGPLKVKLIAMEGDKPLGIIIH